MIEYLLTDLPRYVKTAPRENFANSVVKEGAVLLFSEDGETLVAKHPDGTFSEIGSGSSGGDTSAFESDAMAIIGTPSGGGSGGESGGGSLSYPEGYYLTMNAEAISLTYNFTQTDATATGLNRVWETNDGIYRLKAEPSGDENNYYWGIYTIQNNTQIYATNQSGNINPWALLGWHSETGGVSIAITWTVSEAVA